MDLGIKGKHALITGGSRGIGKAIAKSLLAEGCKVTLLSRTESELASCCEKLNQNESVPRAFYQVFDLSTGDPKQLLQNIEAEAGTLDIIVANAARTSRPKKLTHMPDEDWYGTIESDLNGHYRLLKICLPGLQERQWGRVVFVGSLSGMVGASGYPVYCTVKAAYEGLTKNLAVDY